LNDSLHQADFTDVMILTETRGMPDGLIVSHLPFGPTAYFTLSNCVLRHDIPDCTPASQAYPHMIFESFESSVGQRVSRILQALYPVPKDDSKRVVTFSNNNDYISFRHHVYSKQGLNVTLKEAGPRFEMLPYEVCVLSLLYEWSN
jgi:U3 small nucleolar ribonucleoprotein protein IMP4